MHIWVVLLKKSIIKKIKHTKKQSYVPKCSVMDLIMARAARNYRQLPSTTLSEGTQIEIQKWAP